MSGETEQTEQETTNGDGGEPRSGASEKAQDQAKAREEAQERVQGMEDDPPKKLEDWPDDEAKYVTFGGGEGAHGYEEGPEKNLGPSEVRHHDDGTVTVAGEEVDDPDDYKGEPIPGGPTDPNAPDGPEKRLRDKQTGTGGQADAPDDRASDAL